MPQRYIAVVGLGPKGAAIAAKAAALRQSGFDTPEIIVFEPRRAGAAWSGQFGYTDGEQELCTLAERDVGYPYDQGSFPAHPGVAHATFASFSWHVFSIVAGKGSSAYGEWISRGRRAPLHREFAEYLDFVVSRSGVRVEQEAVIRIDYDHTQKRWTILTNRRPYPVAFDGIVITGSGPPHPPLPNANARVFNGRNFWRDISRVRYLLDMEDVQDQSVTIIGGGGTAAAIALWFARAGVSKIPIHIVGREATLYARIPGYFEDRLFADSAEWKELPAHTQDAFLARLGQGVVWDAVLKELHKNRNVIYKSFSARGFRVDSLPVSPPNLVLELDHPPAAAARVVSPTGGSLPPVGLLPATIFVDARGFDSWWFVNLLSPGPLKEFFQINARSTIMDLINESLAVTGKLLAGASFPAGLHVPMIASRQGPGAPNLMALGWMSDQILAPHILP